MNILLINDNPVVSRLLVLCTRDDAVTLNEVAVAKDVKDDLYDIVLVDDASYDQDVNDLLPRFNESKKVFISYNGDKMTGFDATIKKPFLPSKIFELMKSVEPLSEVLTVNQDPEETVVVNERAEEDDNPTIFPLTAEENTDVESFQKPDEFNLEHEDILLNLENAMEKEVENPVVLDSDEIEKIKTLLDMDEEIEVVDDILSDEEREVRKIEVIKEQLIADGLEIVEEDAIVKELSVNLDGTLEKRKKEKKKKNKSKKKKQAEKNMASIEDAVKLVMSNITKKQMKKLLKGKEIEVRIQLENNDS